MENRNPRRGQGLAAARTELHNFSFAASQQRRSQTVDPPIVVLRLGKISGQYSPGEVLTCEYQIELRNYDLPEDQKIVAIETSVLWRTEGKGDSDIGVHFFERREKKNVLPKLLQQTHKLSTMLPQSPLSYDGSIVKIKWIVRVRVFIKDGTEISHDEEFRLGNACLLTTPPLTIASEEEEDDS